MLEELTIVIITYQRYNFLKRLLKFFLSYELEGRFLVLDSSPDYPDDDELNEILTQHHVTWIRYDSTIFFTSKISKGCKHINTRYAVLCADDDFHILTTLSKCVEFLNYNQDYSSVHGLYFIHTNADKAQKYGFSIGPINANAISSENELAVVRLMEYLSGKTGSYPMYAVHRTELFNLIWTETENFVSDWGLSELFPCSLSFIYGKMKILPLFYSSREPNYHTWYDEKRRQEMFSNEKILLATKGLGKHLCMVDNIEPGKSLLVAKDALNTYLTRSNRKMKSRHKFYITWSMIRKKIGIRTRLRKIFLNGCHFSVYPKYKEDYFKLMTAVMKSNISAEELDKSRQKYAIQGLK